MPDISDVGIPAVTAWAQQHIEEGERAFLATGLLRSPSPPSWEGVVVYQIQVDRFNNGNLSNDVLNVPQDQIEGMAHGDLSGMPGWRHGGDIQGIRDRLGYLADLGVQVLWVTPVLRHTGGYHGYCTADLTTTDPGFGTPEELRSLVHESHEHGILVVLDVVINHMCDTGSNYTGKYDHVTCADTLAQLYWEGNGSVAGQAGLNFGPGFFPPFRSQEFFNRCGPNTPEQMQAEDPSSVFGDFVEGMFDYRTDNRDFQRIFTDLHKYWVAYADVDGFRLDAAKHVTSDFLALFSTEVRAYARTLGKKDFFIIGEVAGSPALQATALGSMEFLLPRYWQNYSGQPAALVETKLLLQPLVERSFAEGRQFPGLPSIYDFETSATARNALQCFTASASVQEWYFSKQLHDISVEGVRKQNLWNVLEIHDWVRYLAPIPDRSDLLKAGVAWLMTAPGSPVLYYGVEQGFNGHCPASFDVGSENATDAIESICGSMACHYSDYPWDMEHHECHSDDALNRQDMFLSGPWRLGSLVPAVNETACIGVCQGTATPASSLPWQSDPMLRRDHAVFNSIRRLTHLRGSCLALARGEIEWIYASEAACGVMAFSRFLEGVDGSDIFVIINPGGGGSVDMERLKSTRTVHRQQVRRSYLNAFNASDTALLSMSAQRLELVPASPTTAPGEVRVFVREDRLGDFNPSLGLALCTPEPAGWAESAASEPEQPGHLGGRKPFLPRPWIAGTLALCALLTAAGCCFCRARRAKVARPPRHPAVDAAPHV